MTAAQELDDELRQLRAFKAEYNVTVRVLAVVVELLLANVGGDTIEITDSRLANSPDLRAWRVNERGAVAITVDRGE